MSRHERPSGDPDLGTLQARVVELEVEVERLRSQHEALATLADRMVVLMRSTHGENSEEFTAVEEAAAAAIRP